MTKTIIERLNEEMATIDTRLVEDPTLKENEIGSKEFLECLEDIYLFKNEEKLLEFRDASKKPLQKQLYAELVESMPDEYETRDFYHKVDAIQGGNAINEFLCKRSAPRIDLAHQNDTKVADYDYNELASYIVYQTAGNSDGKVASWCKKVLGEKK